MSPARAVDPTPAPTPVPDPAAVQGEPCDVCGGSTIEIRCKVICRTCGYTRDCSDP